MKATLLTAIGTLLISSACAAPGVMPGSTTTPTLQPLSGSAVVLGELGRPSTPVATGETPALAMLSLESGRRRLDNAERGLLAIFERAHVADQVVASADLGPHGVSQPAFLVSYRMLNYQEHFDGPDDRYWAGMVVGGLTAGLGYLIAIDSHANSTHTFEFDVCVLSGVRSSTRPASTTDSPGTRIARRVCVARRRRSRPRGAACGGRDTQPDLAVDGQHLGERAAEQHPAPVGEVGPYEPHEIAAARRTGCGLNGA